MGIICFIKMSSWNIFVLSNRFSFAEIVCWHWQYAFSPIFVPASSQPCNDELVQYIIIHVSVNNACDGAFDETYLQALSILTVSSDMQILHAQYLLKDILVAHSVDLWLSFYIGKKFKVMKISGALFILVTGIQELSKL